MQQHRESFIELACKQIVGQVALVVYEEGSETAYLMIDSNGLVEELPKNMGQYLQRVNTFGRRVPMYANVAADVATTHVALYYSSSNWDDARKDGMRGLTRAEREQFKAA